MIAVAGQRLMTADEFYDVCNSRENYNRNLDLVRGEILEMPRPRKSHGVISSNVSYFLYKYAESAHFGYCTAKTGVLLGQNPDTVRGPSCSFWNDIDQGTDFPQRWGTTVPMVAVEVLSPTPLKAYVADKIFDYLSNGVRVVWVFDHVERCAAVHAPNSPQAIYHEDESLISVALPGFTMPVRRAFTFPNGVLVPVHE